MRCLVPLLLVAGLASVPEFASAQGHREQGPLLLVPRSSVNESYGRDSASDVYGFRSQSIRRGDWRYEPNGRDDHFHDDRGRFEHDDHDHYHGPVRYTDSRLQQINQWYVQYLGRSLKRSDEQYWISFFQPNRNGQARSLTDALATILASEEFYEHKVGGRFDDWVNVVTQASGRPISRDEYSHWREDHRRSRNPIETRTDLITHLLIDHAPEPVVVPDRRPAFDRGAEVPWYVREARHEHDHQAAYRGPADREAAAIDAWYRSYLGRPAGEDGIRTWLDQHRQGMSLDQVQASILGSTEAFLQAGSSPPTWVKKSLSALGLRSDDGAVGYWLDRYHRNRGDMPQTALEMIRSGASADRAIRRFNRDDDD